MIPAPDETLDNGTHVWDVTDSTSLWWHANNRTCPWYLTTQEFNGAGRISMSIQLGDAAPSDVFLLIHAKRSANGVR
jgi:hypothetical protein